MLIVRLLVEGHSEAAVLADFAALAAAVLAREPQTTRAVLVAAFGAARDALHRGPPCHAGGGAARARDAGGAALCRVGLLDSGRARCRTPAGGGWRGAVPRAAGLLGGVSAGAGRQVQRRAASSAAVTRSEKRQKDRKTTAAAGWLVLVLAVVCVAYTAALSKPSHCIDRFEPGRDYFAGAVLAAEHAQHFRVSYHQHYKLARNVATAHTYLLVLCGTPRPNLTEPVHATFEVPLTRVASTSTTLLTFFELAGARSAVVAVNGAAFVSSPCLQALLAAGAVSDFAGDPPNRALLESLQVEATFASPGEAPGELVHPVFVPETSETHPLARAEWFACVCMCLSDHSWLTRP
eukprot:TRINITY_DN2318_c0_g2_i5.p2 TRINITY_DN2318_c0_g2~~TRINITY_DN2318_c0_g2_i5.p2  ORF type:complete len:350 (-),score=70.72 TRINITY_DN2318_c0_g2_i5:2-1051(-)